MTRGVGRGQDRKRIAEERQFRVRLVSVFKQQFSVFLKICMGEKVCGNMCNIV